MFCSNCGTQLNNNVKFCSQCGKSISDEKSVDLKKILKKDEFKLNSNSLFAEKGNLILYVNRLSWNGDKNFEIYINDITNVSVQEILGAGALVINTIENKIFKFCKLNSTASLMAGMGIATGNIFNLMTAKAIDNKVSDLEYWRINIEKLRGNL